MSWRKITFIVAALIVLLGGAYALSKLFISMKPEPPRRPEREIKRFVKAQPVSYTEILSSVVVEGWVISGGEVLLVSEASGKIERGSVALKKGTSFRKGQLLATIYKDEVELALKARKTRFLNLLSNLLPDIKIDYPHRYDDFRVFFNGVELDKKLPGLPEISDEKIKVFLSSRNVLSEYYGIKQDEKRLERHALYAPFKGAFTQVNFEVGAYVNTGGQIARMINTEQLEVEAPVMNNQSTWIKIGDKVTVYTRGQQNKKEGYVVRKSSFIDPDTQRRSIFVKIRNHGKEPLLVGELKEVEFPGQVIHEAMEIPRNAVFNNDNVFAVVDGKLKKQQINILKQNDKTLIFNGLEAGTQLVIEPLINVKENLPVEILQ